MHAPVRSLVLLVAALAALIAGARTARAQQAELTASTEEIYAALPFVLSVRASGFAEAPEPVPSELAIAGAQVAYLGQTPSVSSFVSIVNGQRSERRDVTFVYQWRVTAAQPGTFQVPAVSLTQGTLTASTHAAQFMAREVAATADMRLRVALPERPLWVGETFPVTIDWLLKSNVSDQTFTIPLFERDDLVEIAPAEADRAQRLRFQAGSREIELPLERANERLDGADFVRFRFGASATATRAGVADLPPARVLARVQTGTGRDRFGFPVAKTQLFRAEDRPLRLEIRGLPTEGRPTSFSGAVGTGFTIEAKADRTVVRVGDPVTIELVVRGHGRLDGLTLAPLDREGGLSPAIFSLPGEPPAGEMLEGGAKRFRVTVRLRSAQTREVPPLAFSFFNPVTASYQTVRSQPIALSVQDATVVGADAVVAAPLTGPAGGTSSAAPAATPSAGAASSMSGADLALSDEPGTLREAPDVGALLPWIIAAYVLSIAAAGAVVLRVRGERERAAGREIREAVRSCIAAIKAAATRPSAGEAAPAVAGALRSLHRALAGAVAGPEVRRVEDAIASCEREGFDPGARSRPPAAALTTTALEAAGALGDAALRALARRSRAGPAGRAADAAAVGIALALAAVGATVASAAGEDARLAEARLAYARAMAEPARDPRVAAFARAEAIFREVADARPRCPDLLADWGNAAVGARDLGQAVLAYRRALALEPDLARARQNLGWLRAQMPSWVPRGARIGVSIAGPLGERSVAERLLFGALAFAAAALLAAPWGRAPRAMRAAAVLAALAWAATTASVILEPDPAREVVVLEDGVTLRSADSAGAPAVLAHALPAGVEASIVEDREGWLRLELADGARGWVPSAAIARVGGAKRGRAP